DNANWERRIRDNGLSVLYRNALDGFNNMPPRGACVSCNDADVIAAVDYMVHHALDESEWKELQQPPPKSRKQVTGMAIGKRIYAQTCSRCHEKGLNGAPMTGDQAAWAPRLRKNFDVLLNNALRGLNAMPAKGGCEQCTGTEIIAATKYMVQQSQTGRDLSLW
ncbi:MAG: cytochrome C, partial [Gammaproteobacteria bacterium]